MVHGGKRNFWTLFPHSLEREMPPLLIEKRPLPCVQKVVTPFYIVSYYINGVTTSWTHCILMLFFLNLLNPPCIDHIRLEHTIVQEAVPNLYSYLLLDTKHQLPQYQILVIDLNYIKFLFRA